MTVDKLTRLLPALGQSTQSTQAQPLEEQSAKQSDVTSAPAEAVKLAGGFGVDEGGEEDRRSKVDELKKAVAAGSYKPSSYDVAEAVARELFA